MKPAVLLAALAIASLSAPAASQHAHHSGHAHEGRGSHIGRQSCRGTRPGWCGPYYRQQPVQLTELPAYTNPCPGNCSSVGVCNAMLGTCDCPAGWTAADCSKASKAPRQAQQDGGVCFNQCGGNGQCQDGFCRCNAGWFGADCSGKAGGAQPATGGAASALGARPWLQGHLVEPLALGRGGGRRTQPRPLIYVYDVPSFYTSQMLQYRDSQASCVWRHFGQDHSAQLTGGWPYPAEHLLHELMLQSDHRTLDPKEADYFYVPAYTSCFLSGVDPQASGQAWYSPGGPKVKHAALLLLELLRHIQTSYPYWNASQGTDHIWTFSHDEGACWAPSEVYERSVILTHWGRTGHVHAARATSPLYNFSQPGPEPLAPPGLYPGLDQDWRHAIQGHPCYNPVKDLVVPIPRLPAQYASSPLLGGPAHRPRRRLLLFRGDAGQPAGGGGGGGGQWYASGSARRLHAAALEGDWAAKYNVSVDDWGLGRVLPGEEGGGGGGADDQGREYSRLLASSRFCLVLSDHGANPRAEDAILHGCLPVLLTDNVHAPFESLFEADLISMRVSADHLASLPAVLASVPEDVLERMRHRLLLLARRFAYTRQPLLWAALQREVAANRAAAAAAASAPPAPAAAQAAVPAASPPAPAPAPTPTPTPTPAAAPAPAEAAAAGGQGAGQPIIPTEGYLNPIYPSDPDQVRAWVQEEEAWEGPLPGQAPSGAVPAPAPATSEPTFEELAARPAKKQVPPANLHEPVGPEDPEAVKQLIAQDDAWEVGSPADVAAAAAVAAAPAAVAQVAEGPEAAGPAVGPAVEASVEELAARPVKQQVPPANLHDPIGPADPAAVKQLIEQEALWEGGAAGGTAGGGNGSGTAGGGNGSATAAAAAVPAGTGGPGSGRRLRSRPWGATPGWLPRRADAPGVVGHSAHMLQPGVGDGGAAQHRARQPAPQELASNQQQRPHLQLRQAQRAQVQQAQAQASTLVWGWQAQAQGQQLAQPQQLAQQRAQPQELAQQRAQPQWAGLADAQDARIALQHRRRTASAPTLGGAAGSAPGDTWLQAAAPFLLDEHAQQDDAFGTIMQWLYMRMHRTHASVANRGGARRRGGAEAGVHERP